MTDRQAYILGKMLKGWTLSSLRGSKTLQFGLPDEGWHGEHIPRNEYKGLVRAEMIEEDGKTWHPRFERTYYRVTEVGREKLKKKQGGSHEHV